MSNADASLKSKTILTWRYPVLQAFRDVARQDFNVNFGIVVEVIEETVADAGDRSRFGPSRHAAIQDVLGNLQPDSSKRPVDVERSPHLLA